MNNASNLITNFNQKYKNSQFIINEFSKPLFENKFYINKTGLILNSEVILKFKEIWKQNPQKFASEKYGDYEFYRIVLLVNNIPSIFNFDLSFLKNGQFLAPKKHVVYQLFNS